VLRIIVKLVNLREILEVFYYYEIDSEDKWLYSKNVYERRNKLI